MIGRRSPLQLSAISSTAWVKSRRPYVIDTFCPSTTLSLLLSTKYILRSLSPVPGNLYVVFFLLYSLVIPNINFLFGNISPLFLYRVRHRSPFYRSNDLGKTPLQGALDEVTSHRRLLLYEPSLIYVYWGTQLSPS